MSKYLLLLVLISGPLFASGDDIEIDVATGDVTNAAELVGGDNVSKHTSIALAQSFGDVDIGRAAECVITEQYGIIIWQRQNWEYDPWCIAAILDEQGKYHEAAEMRCFHKPTLKLYGDRCIEVLTFDNPPPVILSLPRPELIEEAVVIVEDNDDEERANEFEQRLERIEAGNRAAARKAQERRDYAKQTIQRLENDPEK